MSPSRSVGTSGRVETFSRTELSILLVALVATAVLGVVAASEGEIALVFVILPIGGYLMFKRPLIGLLLFVAMIPLELVFGVSFEGGVSATGTRIIGLAMAGPWFLGKLARGEPFRHLVNLGLIWVGALLVVLALGSVSWAEVPRVSLIGGIQLVQLLGLAIIVVDLLDDQSRLDWCVRGIAIGAIIAAVLTLHSFWIGNVSRAGDVAAGVNQTAEILVTFLPLGFYMLQWERKAGWKLCGLLFVLLTLATIPVTLSRMAMLLLPFVVLAGGWELLRMRQARGWLLAIAIGVAIVGFAFLPRDALVERIATIGPYIEDTVGPGADASDGTSGRGYHWAVGIAIFRDHPVKGVGYNNYGEYFLNEYQFEVSGQSKLYGSRRSPHSSHVGILANLGLVGFGVWTALLGIGFLYLYRAHGTPRVPGKTRSLIRLLGVALFLQAFPYAMYSTNNAGKHLWLLLGLIGAVYCYTTGRRRVGNPGAGGGR